MRPAEQHRYLADVFRSRAEPPVVRFVAALTAVELGGEEFVEEALPVFREGVEVCRGPFPKVPCSEGASPLSAVSGALSPYPRRRLEWLLELLGHRDPEVRKETVWEIGKMCRERRSAPQAVVPHLAKLIADPDSSVRQQVARTLPQLGRASRMATDTLQAFLDHPDPQVRALAAETLKDA
jgi:hypothetical protein